MNLSVFMRFVKREKALAGVLLLDIDHFKQVNDRFGHAEGDRVLSEMSNLIHRNIRDSDLFVRWGGEEFILLMAVDSDQSLEKVAKNIGRLVSENIESPSGSISVSIGGSILKDESDLEHAISRADAGLYYVKAHGRNGYLFVPEDV
jgi:diguanylate cyclase (GGDEF)-like protein